MGEARSHRIASQVAPIDCHLGTYHIFVIVIFIDCHLGTYRIIPCHCNCHCHLGTYHIISYHTLSLSPFYPHPLLGKQNELREITFEGCKAIKSESKYLVDRCNGLLINRAVSELSNGEPIFIGHPFVIGS